MSKLHHNLVRFTGRRAKPAQDPTPEALSVIATKQKAIFQAEMERRCASATFVNREVADQTVEMLAGSPAKIISEVVPAGRWFKVICERG